MGKTHIFRSIFADIQPYAELMRLNMPAGSLVLYFPCIFGTFFVARNQAPVSDLYSLGYVNAVFLLGSILMHGMGCCWNDFVDQDIDRLVERTKLRPMARGALTNNQALTFTLGLLCFGAYLVLKLLGKTCFWIGLPSLVFVAIYPFAKRFTDYPQVVLSIPGIWGIILAYPALGVNVFHGELSTTNAVATLFLILGCMSWTVLYDTIYAAQDVSFDLKIGVKSTMTKYQDSAKSFLWSLAGLMSSCLGAFAAVSGASILFWIIGWGLTSALIVTMVRHVDLKNVSSCDWWFMKGNMVVGLSLTTGFALDYLSSAGSL